MSAEIEERVEELERFQADYQERFEKAFPGGDFEGHRRYHELLKERNEEIRRLRRAVLEKTISGLLWAAIVAIGIGLLEWLRQEIKK